MKKVLISLLVLPAMLFLFIPGCEPDDPDEPYPPPNAHICYGKLCYSSRTTPDFTTQDICCGGHGVCVGFNDCFCEPGWGGNDCTIPPVRTNLNALDFGSVIVGAGAKEQTLFVVKIDRRYELDAEISGEYSSDYTVTSITCGLFFEVPGGGGGGLHMDEFCQVTVSFSPSGTGRRRAALSLRLVPDYHNLTPHLPIPLNGYGEEP